jgi:hypothetical protein
VQIPTLSFDASVNPEDLADFTTGSSSLEDPSRQPTHHLKPPWPFANMSQFLLMNWHVNGSSQKSEHELNLLAKKVIGHPEFKSEDLASFNAHQEHKKLDSARETVAAGTPSQQDGW